MNWLKLQWQTLSTYFSTWTDQHTLGNTKGWLKWHFVLHEKNSEGMRSQFLPFLIILSSYSVSGLNENEDIKESYTQWQSGKKEIKFIPHIFTSEYKKCEKQQFIHPSNSSCLTRYEDCPFLLYLLYWGFLFCFVFFGVNQHPYWNVFSAEPEDSYFYDRDDEPELTSPSIALSLSMYTHIPTPSVT